LRASTASGACKAEQVPQPVQAQQAEDGGPVRPDHTNIIIV
jgi:hypothetical protein